MSWLESALLSSLAATRRAAGSQRPECLLHGQCGHRSDSKHHWPQHSSLSGALACAVDSVLHKLFHALHIYDFLYAGKSFLLNRIIASLKTTYVADFTKCVAVTAATGIAATHICGEPLLSAHSHVAAENVRLALVIS